MSEYFCVTCNFSSKLKSNYQRHLNTNKHKKRINLLGNNSFSNGKKPSKFTPNPSKIPKKPSEIPPKPSKIYVCEHCNKEFSRKDNLKRHMLARCKGSNEDVDYKQMFYEMKHELLKEKQEFKQQINILLDKVGNTTNNITQNIQLNSYGNEDMSHITDTLKTQMLKIPFGMIPKMIEAVHFNDDKPENKNIALSNVRDNKIKIFTNDKWVYKDKEETINDLVEGKYFILDNHYKNIEDKTTFDVQEQQTIDKFKTYFREGDKNFVEKLKKDCELLLLNNR